MSASALILGGNGDIGSAISSKFTSNGYTVKKVGRADFNLANKKEIHEFFKKDKDYDVLVHCAAVNLPKNSRIFPLMIYLTR